MDVCNPASPLDGLLILAKSSPSFSNGQMVLCLLIVGITAMLLISTRRRVRQARSSPQAYTREQRSRLREEESVVQDMQELMVQLEDVSRGIQAQLDTKFAKLDSVIADADDRLDRLERMIRRCDGKPALEVTVDDQTPPAPPVVPRDDPDRRLIFELADAGRSAVEIAQQTGQSTGEIELILALRNTATAPAP